MKRIFLRMYLTKNLGDDLFLKIISNRYGNVRFYTLARNNYLRRYIGQNVRGRFIITRLICKLFPCLTYPLFRLRKYDAEVVLGGSMFIEREPNKTKLLDELNKRYIKDVPLFIIGANFGPFKNKYYLHEHKNVFRSAKDVCFRDNYSAGLFSDLDNVRVAPDIVFGLDSEKYKAKHEKKVVVSVIDLKTREKLKQFQADYENKILEIAEKYASGGYNVVLMSFCEAEGDEDAINRILQKTSNSKISSYYYRGDIDEAVRQISSSEIVVGTRFHSVVLGIVFGKKVLPVIYSSKTKNMLEDIGFSGRTIELKNISKLKADRIDSWLTEYGNVDRLNRASEAHFEKLDGLLGRIEQWRLSIKN